MRQGEDGRAWEGRGERGGWDVGASGMVRRRTVIVTVISVVVIIIVVIVAVTVVVVVVVVVVMRQIDGPRYAGHEVDRALGLRSVRSGR